MRGSEINSDDLINAAVDALDTGNQDLASECYEKAASLLLEDGNPEAAAIHLMLAAQYEHKENGRADALLRRAQEAYLSRSEYAKAIETLLVRAVRAAREGREGPAERLFSEVILFSAERLAVIARHSLEIQAPFLADPEANVLIDQITHSRNRMKELRSHGDD
ncbi:hypothetical protein [Streptomyces sp. NPDC058155]|uniref:hypothetical protein n=1 Tax=Streptomyces sp. NPDC058155 TaxID=3346359 RepID=UPI0036EB2E3F